MCKLTVYTLNSMVARILAKSVNSLHFHLHLKKIPTNDDFRDRCKLFTPFVVFSMVARV